MARLRGIHRGLLAACGALAGTIFALIALFVSADVLIRNLGIGNFPWLLEVAEYGLCVATFIAAPWVLHQGAHVRVDLLPAALGARAARRLERGADLLGLAISLVLLHYGWAAFADAWRLGSLIFKELVIPEWWLLGFVPASMALLSIEFALRLTRADRGAG